MMVGLQGSGKTTTAGKLARKMKREMRQTRMVACDVYRPAAVDQLQTLGEQVGVPVYAEPGVTDVVGIAKRALETAKRERDRVVIFDTAGRLQIDEEMMDELKRLKAGDPADRDPLRRGRHDRPGGGHDRRGLRRGARRHRRGAHQDGRRRPRRRGALDLRRHGKPIKFLGVGEKLDGLEEFPPGADGRRILQQGDVLTLVERRRAPSTRRGGEAREEGAGRRRFDLEDFLTALRQMQNLGAAREPAQAAAGRQQQDAEERQGRPAADEAHRGDHPLDDARGAEAPGAAERLPPRPHLPRLRPAGEEINRLLAQFKDMQKLMKQMKGLQGMMPSGCSS
jgi:signal recognition particle subunit SRP54